LLLVLYLGLVGTTGNRVIIMALYSNLDNVYNPDDYSGYIDDVDNNSYSSLYLYSDLRGLGLS
jgi:hypothetical protein